MGVERQSVRADHGVGMGWDTLEIFLMHGEVNGAGRLQAFRRLVDVDPHFGGNIVRVATAGFGDRLGPGNQNPLRLLEQICFQNRRAGGVGIDFEAHRLMGGMLVDMGQRVGAEASLVTALHLMMPDDGSAVAFAADLEDFLQTVENTLGLITYVGHITRAIGLENLAGFDHFTGRGSFRRIIDQARRQAAGARFQALLQAVAHDFDLLIRGRPVGTVQHAET